MEDVVILAIGRQHIELATTTERLIELVKKLQTENANLKAEAAAKPKE